MAAGLTHFCHCVIDTLGTGLPLTPHTEGFLALTVSFNGPASASHCGSPLMESFLWASHSVILPGKVEFFPGNLQPFLQGEMEMLLRWFHVFTIFCSIIIQSLLYMVEFTFISWLVELKVSFFSAERVNQNWSCVCFSPCLLAWR